MEIESMSAELRKFAVEREWEQFHSPKNLSSALVVEAAELLEIFQWMKEDDSRLLTETTLNKVKEEIADIQIYILRLADVLGISIPDAVNSKMKKNAEKYPVHKARGSSKKYNEL
jgi:NTP pyrophosphatase (non-canonical NTP hydrolase)